MAKDTSGKSQRKKELNKLYAAVSIFAGMLLVMTLFLSYPLITGSKIILATRPVDPFDPLRGQYITINYDITRLPILQGVKAGDKVYVSLKADEKGISRYRSASLEKQEGEFIRGTVVYTEYAEMTVRYGIEQYFFERMASLPRGNLTVEAKVAKNGQARISRLLYEGKPAELIYREPSIKS